MGNNTSLRNPMFEDWKPHPTLPETYVNLKTKKHVRRDVVILEESEEFIIGKRMNESHSYIAKVEYYQALEVYKSAIGKAKEAKYQIFTDSIYPIMREHWVPVESVLTMLRGFRRLTTSHGFFRVSEDMVRMNEKFEIKVWINSNPAICRVGEAANSEQKMLADITTIMMKYDSTTGALMTGCTLINDAFNAILRSIPENRVQSHLSNRTYANDHQVKAKNPSREANKNLFRSTKETEDEFPKPVRDLDQFYEKDGSLNANPIVKHPLMNQPSILHHVQQQKKPYFIQSHQAHEDSSKPPNRKMYTENSTSNRYQYQSESYVTGDGHSYSKVSHPDSSSNQSTSTLHFNNTTNPQKSFIDNRHSKMPNSNVFLTHYLSPMANKPRRTAEDRFKQALSPNAPFYNRRSDLNHQYIEKIDEGRPSDFTAVRYKKSQMYFAEHAEIPNTYRDLSMKEQKKEIQFGPKETSKRQTHQNWKDSHGNADRKMHKTGSGDMEISSGGYSNRNRTQELNAAAKKDSGQSTWKKYEIQNRFKTKPVNEFFEEPHENEVGLFTKKEKFQTKDEIPAHFRNNVHKPNSNPDGPRKEDLFYSQHYQEDYKTPNSTYRVLKKSSFPVAMVEDSSNDASLNFEQKKAMKQKLAQKLREQLGGVLDTSPKKTSAETEEIGGGLVREKSSRDIMIKKKVEEKKKNFAQLKSQAMKLLID